MTLTIEDVVTHYILSSHPKNKAIVDIKDKKTGDLRYIKIRHRLPKFYSVSLVDPVTFEAWAETQAKSASTRIKPIVLHATKKDEHDVSVDFRESSRIVFEWTFSWEGETYKWVRESRMSSVLECKASRKTGDICVAQYLPRMLKDEYFGIFSLLGYNMLRCKLTKSRELELIILMSLMTLLDKSNDGGWKKDQISMGMQDDILESYKKAAANNSNNVVDNEVLPVAYEDPIPKKAQQKKYRKELLNDQKLQLLLERDVKRSQKQIQSDHRSQKSSMSADNTPTQTPKTSPLPTPSSSSTFVRSPTALTRQKSASLLLGYNTPSTSNHSSTQSSPTETQHNNSSYNYNGRLTKLFSSLSHMKHGNASSKANTLVEPFESINSTSHRPVIHKQHNMEDDDDSYYHYNQHSLPVGYTAAQFTNEFGKLSIQSRSNDNNNPPSLRSIRWNPEPYIPAVTTRRPRLDDSRRRMSATTDYIYNAYQPPQHFYSHHVRHPSNSEYFVHPYQTHFDYF